MFVTKETRVYLRYTISYYSKPFKTRLFAKLALTKHRNALISKRYNPTSITKENGRYVFEVPSTAEELDEKGLIRTVYTLYKQEWGVK